MIKIIKRIVMSIGEEMDFDELEEKDMYKLDPLVDDGNTDIVKALMPTNTRFTLVAYSDASFATGQAKQSVTGFVVLINGIPLMLGSLKQTIVVDSTCSALYVAASVMQF
jgi:hypothetical protein